MPAPGLRLRLGMVRPELALRLVLGLPTALPACPALMGLLLLRVALPIGFFLVPDLLLRVALPFLYLLAGIFAPLQSPCPWQEPEDDSCQSKSSGGRLPQHHATGATPPSWARNDALFG